MATGRITKLGAFLLGTAMTVWAAPSMAGFEFMPATGTTQQAALAPAADTLDAPMPIVPSVPVTAEPLDAAPAGDPVYIHRQRNIVMKAPKGQPMDTDALLRATENTDMVELEGSPRVNKGTANASQLVINPYPLQDNNAAAVHGGDMGQLSVEQAMMEETGNLRTVAVPGKGNTGAIARAKITSRYDKGAQYMERPRAAQSSEFTVSSITPIPGGEGEPLSAVESAPLAPIAQVPRAPVVPARVSPMPRPATPQGHLAPAQQQSSAAGGYADAVGFGRDLPLALALSQVVPPEYSYAFGQNVDVGATVSWQGGKPWTEVLNEMLAQNGMVAVIDNNQITIQNSQS